MIIRRATLSDLDQLVELFEAYRIWYRQEADSARATEFLNERLTKEDAIIYIAVHEGSAVGFTQLYPSFSSTRMARLWVLNDLYVSEKYRGQQISKKLIAAAKDTCRETNGCGILLETEKNNSIGNNLYPKTGFHLEENNFYFWTNK